MSISSGIRVLAKYTILSFILFLPVLFVTQITANIYFMLIALVVGVMVYLFILYHFNLDIRKVMHRISGKILLGKPL